MKVQLNQELLQKIFPGNNGGHFGELVNIAIYVIGMIMAITAITAIIALAINIVKWARSADNPGARQEAQRNMLICGIGLAVLGGFGTVYAIIMMFMF